VRRALIASCVGAALAPSIHLAQDALPEPGETDEIIPSPVERPVDSAGNDAHAPSVTMTTLDERQIDGALITSVQDLTTLAPNLVAGDSNMDRSLRFSIRGLRENNFGAGESAVGLYVDDIPFSGLSARDAPFLDASTVEILRGARGTLYGAARPGGLIRVTTRPPGNSWRGNASLTYGNYKAASAQAAVSGPVVKDKLQFSIAGLASQRDGFMNNSFDGSHPDDRQTFSGRVQLSYQPNDHWDLALIAAGSRFRDGMMPTVALDSPDPFTVSRDDNGHAHTDSVQLAFKAAYDHPQWRGVSVTSFRDWNQDIEQDFDFSAAPIRIGFTRPELQEINQEIRVHSNDPDRALQWAGGAYFSDRDYNGDSGTIELQPLANLPGVPPPITDRTTYQQDNLNTALFGQLAYTFLEQFEVTGGLRWEHDHRRMNRQHQFEFSGGTSGIPAPIEVSDDWNALQPRAVFAWDASESVTLYTSAAKGYQSGGFNPSSDVPNQVRYEQADSWTLELGSRSVHVQDRLAINTTLFYTETTDYQVFRPADPFGNYYLVNAPRVEAYGAELELSYEPIDHLNVNVGFGYTHAEFREFTDAATGVNFDGNRVNFVPELTSMLGARYRFSFGLVARVETRIVGRQFWDEANTRSQNAYALLNASIGYEDDGFGIHLWGRNLTDETYFSNALDFGADFGGAYFGVPGTPAMFGISVTGRF